MSSTMRTTYRMHARKARTAMRRKPRLSVGLASVVLASLWKLWRHMRIVKKRSRDQISQLADELHMVKRTLQEVCAEQKSIVDALRLAAQSREAPSPTDELNKRLLRLEEDVASCVMRQGQAGSAHSHGDPFLYESQPLLPEGATSSGVLPESLQFDFTSRGGGGDAMSSDQSLEIYRQSGPSGWDLMDLGSQPAPSQPYERLLENAQSSPKAHKVQSGSTDMLDLLGLPIPPSTPALPDASSSCGARAAPTPDANGIPDNTVDAPAQEEAPAGLGTPAARPQVSVHLQRRRSLVTRQALRHNMLCAQEESREVYNSQALEALSRAGEQLRKTEKLLSEAEEQDEAAERLKHSVEPGAEKPAALRIAEHRAAKAKSACDSAYSTLCLAIDSATRQAAAGPLQDGASQHSMSRSGSNKNLAPMAPSRTEAAASSDHPPSKLGPSRLSFRNGVIVQSQRAPTTGPPRHQRSGSVAAVSQAPSLERRSMGEEGYQPTSNASPQPSSGPRLEKHKRSLSDTFDGSSATNRAGMPSAEPLGPKASLGSINARHSEMEAKNQALINELELRRLALHRS